MSEIEGVRVGFVGLGAMGAPMAANIASSGADVRAWTRHPERLSEDGLGSACRVDERRSVADGADVVALCVTDGPDVLEVLFGDDGLAEHIAPGTVVVDFSTISPVTARAIAERLGERGVGFVDAPVTGGTEGARRGTLSVLVGGDDAAVARVRPVLEAVGTTVTHLGPVGAGQWAKAINQVILAGTYLAVAEGVTLALAAGLDASAIVGALAPGAAGSWVLSQRASRMIDDEYPLGFRLSLHRKDLRIALDLAGKVGASLPVASLAATLEDGLIARGYGDEDNAALARAIRGLAGLEGPSSDR